MLLDDGGHEALHTVARQRGESHDGHTLPLRQQLVHPIRQCPQQLGLVLDEVPFVDGNHHGPALALDKIGDLQVLRLEGNGCVDDQHDKFSHLYLFDGCADGHFLETFLDARLAPQARRVDEADTPPLPVPLDIDGIARGAGDGACDRALRPDELVEERRLARVGPTRDGNRQGALALGLAVVVLPVGLVLPVVPVEGFVIFGDMMGECAPQLGETRAMGCR